MALLTIVLLSITLVCDIINNTGVKNVKNTMLDHIISTIAPHYCCSCMRIGAILCESCKYDIVSESFNACVGCLGPTSGHGVCGSCRPDLLVDKIWCVGLREGKLKALGDAYKFHSRREAADALAEIIDNVLPILPDDFELVAIPATPKMIRLRGFDHTKLVVRQLARMRQMKTARPLVRTSNETLHFLGKAERKRLADKLFNIRPGVVPRKVLLVDDILTTGTTLSAAARLLRSAGVKEIYGVVIARQPSDKLKHREVLEQSNQR